MAYVQAGAEKTRTQAWTDPVHVPALPVDIPVYGVPAGFRRTSVEGEEMAKHCRKHPQVVMEKTTSLRKGTRTKGGKLPAKGWKKTWTCRLCPVPYRRWF